MKEKSKCRYEKSVYLGPLGPGESRCPASGVIMTRTIFSGWKRSTRSEALAMARFLFRSITTARGDSDLAALSQVRIAGVNFTLRDLK